MGPRRYGGDSELGFMLPWFLMMAILMLGMGGLGYDMWRAVGERRALQEACDSAARAGANGIDLDVFDATGELVLDSGLANGLALDNYNRNKNESPSPVRSAVGQPRFFSTTDTITVEINGNIETIFLQIFVIGEIPVQVECEASPRLVTSSGISPGSNEVTPPPETPTPDGS